MITIPAHSRTLTVGTYIIGLAFFVWLGAADESAWGATALGALLPAIFLAHFLVRRFGGKSLALRKAMLLLSAGGLLAGCAAPLVTAMLMAIKVSLSVSLYPPEMVLSLLERTPWWALIGLIVGTGLALTVYARRQPTSP
jgi:hypothetical protein